MHGVSGAWTIVKHAPYQVRPDLHLRRFARESTQLVGRRAAGARHSAPRCADFGRVRSGEQPTRNLAEL